MVFPAGSLRWHCSCAGNGIGVEGMRAFSEALKSNSSLTAVNLDSMPVRHHMNVRCMRLRLCCVALGPGSGCCHGALVQRVLIRSRALHVTGVGVFVEHLLPPPPPFLRLASAVVGAEDFGLGDVPQRCWCPRARPCAGAARTMCQASARGRATHALPGHMNQKWPTCGQGGYVTPAASGIPSASERGAESEVAHLWARWVRNPCRLGDPLRFRAGGRIRSGPLVGKVGT